MSTMVFVAPEDRMIYFPLGIQGGPYELHVGPIRHDLGGFLSQEYTFRPLRRAEAQAPQGFPAKECTRNPAELEPVPIPPVLEHTT